MTDAEYATYLASLTPEKRAKLAAIQAEIQEDAKREAAQKAINRAEVKP